MTADRQNLPRLLLSALRAPGGGAFILPGVAVKVLGLPPSPTSTFLVRMFAARNVALAAGLMASDRKGREVWWKAGIVCDALDAAAGVLAFADGRDRTKCTVDTSAALLATGLGVAGLRADR